MGSTAARQELKKAWDESSAGAVHDAQSDALLACANRLLTDGNKGQAAKIFQAIHDRETNGATRVAAFRGLILSTEKRGVKLMLDAIAGSDMPGQGAALQLAAKMRGGPATTKALAGLLPKAPLPVQIALLQSLQQRGDSSAEVFVAGMMDNSNLDARLAAITALGYLGDGSVSLLLARKAASTSGAEKTAARAALLRLRGNVTQALLQAFTTATPEVKPELIQALGDRGDTSAVPRLLELAHGQDQAMRSSSLQALALLATPAQLPDLVQLVVQAPNDDARSSAADALSAACERIRSRNGHYEAEALLQAVRSGPLEARLVLLPACSDMTGTSVREVLRAALEDPEARVREAAMHALCDTRDAGLLPDLLKAATTGDEKTRLLAIRGCVRLLTQEESVKMSNDQKLAALKTVMTPPLVISEKRLILSGLSAIADGHAMTLASTLLDDPPVKEEAARAVIQIADSLVSTHPEEGAEAIRKVLTVVTDPATEASARAAQKKIWKVSGYVTLWRVAGPYQQQGKDYSALFDIPFAPESGDSAPVRWQNVPAGNVIDLLNALGGEQRVAYALTWIHSSVKQNVCLEMGSDDGIKVWLNNSIVFAKNIGRPLEADSDEADVTLNQGWNRLVLKVTQNTGGWGYCIRFTSPGGEPATGLRASLDPKP
jgi:HEAT repeat protein